MLNEIPKDIMYVYLAGMMLGGKDQKQTVDWRYRVRKYYENWKDKGIYEIAFLDPWNGEVNAEIDEEGLTNAMVTANCIYQGDLKSIQKADLIVANLDQFNAKRPSIGTFMECGIALALRKPIIFIVNPDEIEKYKKHPFISQGAAIFSSVNEFLEAKILNWFYKRTNHANYEWEL